MTREEKSISRILFQNKINKSDGQVFEDLFTQILSYSDKEFRQIKPWGNIGDRKNDGYIKSKGIYYQVFAPEDVSKSYPDVIKKINTDFSGIKEHWNNIIEVKEFYFVLNDKYKGVNADSEILLETIRNDNNLDKCEFITSSNLEDILFELEEDQIFNIIGFLPDPKNIDLDYSILNEILGHIQSVPIKKRKENVVVPNWDKKIIFNNLGIHESTSLLNGSFMQYHLDEYLNNNGAFLSSELQNKVSTLYLDISKEIDNGVDVFWELVNTLSPKANSEYQSSVIVIMAKYFETCDIFEEPNK